jgi:tRNA-specific 2-thiouridylase
MTTSSTRVLVAMSGGVDSSVAAALLRDAGYDVTGVTLKLWGGESDSGCCSAADVEDARRVAAQLDIRLLERADALGFDAVATGHHARVHRGADGHRQLRRGADVLKDQSYVLYMLGQSELARTLLPVGELTKAQVREHATRLGLRTATKPESMDVCFITHGNRNEFVTARAGAQPGPVVDGDGAVLGRHDGVTGFTIGQRRGVGVATGERRYVVDIDAAAATVTLGGRDELLRDTAEVRDLRFVDRVPDIDELLEVQVRAHGTPVPGRLDGPCVRFEQPQPRVAPGQVVALYAGDTLLGGGIAT